MKKLSYVRKKTKLIANPVCGWLPNYDESHSKCTYNLFTLYGRKKGTSLENYLKKHSKEYNIFLVTKTVEEEKIATN